MKLYINKIDKLEEKGLIGGDIVEVLNIFLSAINDWPISVESLDDYEAQVHEFINAVTLKRNIEVSINEADLSKNALQAESLSQIIGIFEY